MPGFFSRNQAPAPRDFQPEDNPTSPLGVFFTVLRINFGNIVKVNLLYFLFMIPTLVWLFVNIMVMNNLLETSKILEQTMNVTDLLPTITVFLLGCVVTELPLGPAKCALAYVMRFLSQDEHSFVVDDFFAAYKVNWKQGMGMNLISSLINCLVYMAALSYWQKSAGNPYLMFFVYALLVMMLLFVMMQHYIYPMIVTYDMTLLSIVRTSMLVTISNLPLSLASTILSSVIGVAIVAYSLLSNMSIGVTVGILFFAVVGYALDQLIRSSFVHRVFGDMLVSSDHEEASQEDETLPEDRA